MSAKRMLAFAFEAEILRQYVFPVYHVIALALFIESKRCLSTPGPIFTSCRIFYLVGQADFPSEALSGKQVWQSVSFLSLSNRQEMIVKL